MAIRYELKTTMERVTIDGAETLTLQAALDIDRAGRAEVPVVEVLTPEEANESQRLPEEFREAVESLVTAESNMAEPLGDSVVGSFAVPDRADLTQDPAVFSFFLNRNSLIFVDAGRTAADLLAQMASEKLLSSLTPGHCLYVFFKLLIMNDFVFLSDLEDEMEDIEEEMLAQQVDVSTAQIMRYRRQTIELGMYYQQLAAMADIISDNENRVLSHAEAHSFDRIATFADRLTSRAETLKEYSMQLHELHQTRISLKQNSIMQTFTIVTVLFAPLTLVTGWFGMNLAVMPGLDWPFMSVALIGFALLFTVSMLALFRRKGWL